MTSLEAYKIFLLKINKNDSNRNINISKGEFVLKYNIQRLVWLYDKVPSTESTDEINELNPLLKLDLDLEKVVSKENYTTFKLPEDFGKYVRSYSLASKNSCTNSVIYNNPVKGKNLNELLRSENDKPSFEYEETFYSLNDSLISIYKTDFEVEKVFLDYYRQPEKIDIGGYIKVDGSQSADIDPNIPDELVNQIIEYCVRDTIGSYVIPEAFDARK